MKSLKDQLQEIFGYKKDNKKSRSLYIAKPREQGNKNKLCPYCKKKIDAGNYESHIKAKHKLTIQSNSIRKKLKNSKDAELVQCPKCKSRVKKKNLEKHIRRNHVQISNRFGSKKKRKIKKGRKYFDFSLYTKRNAGGLTPEQKEHRERIQRRGFHEGAKVPGSNVRKIDK
jgi:endogenous inhibitor of DNA gyrase (YacG/DUF329 family)